MCRGSRLGPYHAAVILRSMTTTLFDPAAAAIHQQLMDADVDAGARMIVALRIAFLCCFLAGCFAPGSGTVPRFASSRMDSRIVTSVSTEVERSAVPHNNRIHSYDAAALFNVSRYDDRTRRLATPASERLAEYSQHLAGSDFNEFQLAWGDVESGLYTISRVFQDAGRSLALTCMTNEGTILPGVVPTPVHPGDIVYFGHAVLTLKVWPAAAGGVSHPARIVGIRVMDRPPGLEAELRKAGMDPARLRFVAHPGTGCRPAEIQQTFRRY